MFGELGSARWRRRERGRRRVASAGTATSTTILSRDASTVLRSLCRACLRRPPATSAALRLRRVVVQSTAAGVQHTLVVRGAMRGQARAPTRHAAPQIVCSDGQLFACGRNNFGAHRSSRPIDRRCDNVGRLSSSSSSLSSSSSFAGQLGVAARKPDELYQVPIGEAVTLAACGMTHSVVACGAFDARATVGGGVTRRQRPVGCWRLAATRSARSAAAMWRRRRARARWWWRWSMRPVAWRRRSLSATT